MESRTTANLPKLGLDPGRLLLVAPDDVVREGIQAVLLGAFPGVDLVMASTFTEAFRVMLEKPAMTLIAEQHLPDVRGSQLIHWAKELHPDVRCLLMAPPSEPDAPMLRPLKVEVLRRPFSREQLLQRLAALGVYAP